MPAEGKKLPLTRLAVGQGGTVASLNGCPPDRIRQLLALGVYPGLSLRLLQRFPTYVIAVGYTQLAIDAETAQGIEVIIPSPPPCRGQGRGWNPYRVLFSSAAALRRAIARFKASSART